MNLKRYLSIYALLWRNSLVREMGFKVNFIMWIFVELIWFALQLTFVSVIFLHTDRIADWTKWQVVMLFGVSHFIQQLFQAFFMTNCIQLSELVRTGKLDFMLLLPVNTRFLLSLRMVDFGAFINAGTAVGVMLYAARQLHIFPNAAQIAGFLILCGVGIVIHYSLMFLLAGISFWVVRAQGIVWGYYQMFNIARMPDTALHGWFKAFFKFAIPMLLVSNVPAKVLTHKLNDPFASPYEIPLLVILAGVCFLISELGWKFSVKKYTSASS